MNILVALIAFCLDYAFGYPAPISRRIGYPVQWMGKLIAWLDKRYNRTDISRIGRKLFGLWALCILLLVTLVISLVISLILRALPFGWVLEAIVAVPFLAGRELRQMVARVGEALEISLVDGRQAVGHIVGRDTAELEESGVAGAALESLAENASDGLFAPLFWLCVFGLPGVALYKAINTADSMIGHMNAKYADFGWASAKLDDWANWIPARLSAFIIALASLLTPDANASQSLSAAFRDAKNHKSPNAGWPEAALAGGLGLAFGGPRAYEGKIRDLPFMGNGRRDLTRQDIANGIELYDQSRLITFLVLLGLSLFVVLL